MGHTTRISDYEWGRGDGVKEVPEGVDIESHDSEKHVKAKKIEPKDDKPVSTSRSAKTKDVGDK